MSESKTHAVQVTVVLSDDEKVRVLNKQFRSEDSVTDVLTFPVNQEQEAGIFFLGEIVVNHQQARRQAKEYGVSEEEEVARLITHGALHLLGYDDEDKGDREEMERVQERIVKKLKIESSKCKI